MMNQACRRAAAHESAAGLTAALLLARCRDGAAQPLSMFEPLPASPQGRWLAAASQGLCQWLQEGGFAAHDVMPGAFNGAVDWDRYQQ